MVLGASVPALADSVTGTLQNGYGRLSFNTASKVSATTTGGVLAISFSAKTDIDPAGDRGRDAARHHQRPCRSRRQDACALSWPSRSSCMSARSAITPWSIWRATDFTGAMPDLVRAAQARGQAGGHRRPARDQAAHRAPMKNSPAWCSTGRSDVSYQVFPGAGKMTIRFDTPARTDVSAIARFAPPWVKNASWRIEGTIHHRGIRNRFRFGLSRFQGRHACRAGYPGAQDRWRVLCAARCRQAGDHGDDRPPPKPGASQAQAQAIAQASQQLAGKPAAKPADTKQADSQARHKNRRRQASRSKTARTAAQPADGGRARHAPPSRSPMPGAPATAPSSPSRAPASCRRPSSCAA